jgi:immunoglobulin-binding protein 1
LFHSAKSKEADLQHVESSSNAYQDSLQAAISALEECRDLIERVAVFSPNETSEDIATSSIQ